MKKGKAAFVITVTIDYSKSLMRMMLICNDFTFQDIFRKYPNQYEVIIGTLCENLDNLDEPEAKAAMIWIIGQYADRIENADVLLDDFLYCFLDEPVEVSAL